MPGLDTNSRTLNQTVFNYIKEGILNGHYRPGQRLVQDEIARELNVSRIPVREALQRLRAEEFVNIVPHKGAVVARFTAEDLSELFTLRTILEVKAAVTAANRSSPELTEALEAILRQTRECLDRPEDMEKWNKLVALNRDFHLTLCRASGMKRTYSIVLGLWDRFPGFGSAIPGRSEIVFEEHQAILQAIKSGKADEVETLFKNHLTRSEARFLSYYDEMSRLVYDSF